MSKVPWRDGPSHDGGSREACSMISTCQSLPIPIYFKLYMAKNVDGIILIILRKKIILDSKDICETQSVCVFIRERQMNLTKISSDWIKT